MDVKRLTLVGLVAVTAYLLLGSCNRKPGGPAEPVVKDYAVYMKEGFNPGWIYAYHPVTNIVDSFYWLTDGPMVVSADGQTLYCRPDGSPNMAAVALDSIKCGDTLVVDHMLPFSLIAAVSPDNQLMAVLDIGYDGFSIVKTSDYSVVIHGTELVGGGSFTQDSQRYYSSNGIIVDINETPPVIRLWPCPFGSLYDLVPSKDESTWHLMVKQDQFDFLFMVYNPLADSVLFSTYLTPGYGEVELTTDGKQVFYTNAGTGVISIGPYPPPFFHVYDPETNTANDTIWTTGVCASVDAFPISELAVTPDGRWLVAIHAGFGEIVALNLESMQIEKCYSLGRGHSLQFLTCQQIP